MTSPTDLRTRLAGALSLPKSGIFNSVDVYTIAYADGIRAEAFRLAPLHSALADCAAGASALMKALDNYGVTLGDLFGHDEAFGDAQEVTREALTRLGEAIAKGEGR